MGPRRRRYLAGQSKAGDHARLRLRANWRSRLRSSRVVRRGGAGRRRHDEPDRLSRSDSADTRRAVDRRLPYRAVHDVVVARRADLRAHDRQRPVDRRCAVRSDSQNAGRHDGRVFSERRRARAFRKSRARIPAARHLPGERRMGRDGRDRRRLFANAACDRTRSRRSEMGNGAHATRIDRRNRVRRDPARMDLRAHRERRRCGDGGGRRALLANHDEQRHRRGPRSIARAGCTSNGKTSRWAK